MDRSERKSVSEDRILLEGMVFHGRHGTLPAEREMGQNLRPAGLSDELEKTVDYGEVYRQAKEIVGGTPVNLTETVAERIAAAILEEHPLVEAVRVKVAKPHVRLGDTVLAASAIEIVRHRGTS